MIIAKTVQDRQDLESRFYEAVRPHIFGYGRKNDKIYRAFSVTDAKRKIGGGIRLDMVVFGEELPESEIDKLRDCFFPNHLAPSFVMLRPARVA